MSTTNKDILDSLTEHVTETKTFFKEIGGQIREVSDNQLVMGEDIKRLKSDMNERKATDKDHYERLSAVDTKVAVVETSLETATKDATKRGVWAGGGAGVAGGGIIATIIAAILYWFERKLSGSD